ncbi:MAG TPA: IPT/TIG domain-containing protein [Pyrinomonadaceae bacterium]|jgi:hypothetical protein
MAIGQSKPKAERNKLMLAIALGTLAIISLWYMLFSSSPNTNTPKGNSNRKSANTAPTPSNSNGQNLLVKGGQDAPYLGPVDYPERPAAVPEAGRNIFAFYVPPAPKAAAPAASAVPQISPTPTPKPPNLVLASVSPVNVYARTGDFTLDITGDKFTSAVRIYVGDAELPTRFISAQQLSATVPASLISFEGPRQVSVRSRDGQFFSNAATLNVMPAPTPNYTYVGILSRRGSNDTAILKDKGGKDLLNVQRGDILGGRFRVTSISIREVALIDTSLRIKHTLPLTGDNSAPGAPGQQRYPPPPPPQGGDDEDGEP